MKTRAPSFLLLIPFVGLACGGTDEPTGAQVRDVRVAIPAPEAGIFDLVTPEVEIPAGEERLYCLYLSYDEPDVAVTTMEALQGQGGHHVVLLTTREPKPVGTFSDCTSVDEMRALDPFILPGIELPAKHGIKLETGTQFVLQFHYVNPFVETLLVRDVARVHTIAVAEVETWVAPFVSNHYDFALAATPGETTVQFDCEVPFDLDLLLVGGHLHEQGMKFEVEVGATVGDLRSIYLVDPWKPDFRDAPPVSLFFSAPEEMKSGSVIRTTCVFDNQTGRALAFPEEMCSAFGYAAGRQEPYICANQ